MNRMLDRLLWLSALLFTGCAVVQPSTPGAVPLQQGVTLVRTLPEQLPDKSTPFPHAQFVLIVSESAAGMLVPVPFVGDAVAGAMHASAAADYAARYAAVDPYRIVLAAMQGSPVLKPASAAQPGLKLQPFVFVQECFDDRYRLSLVAHVQDSEWVGRYFVHLPTTYAAAEYQAPTPELLAALGKDLNDGAVELRQLVERAARDELKPSGIRADIGSLYLTGGKPAGLLSPMLVLARNVDLIQEGQEHILVRAGGDMKAAASVGGLQFGVHRFRKDQLHTFKKLEAGKP